MSLLSMYSGEAILESWPSMNMSMNMPWTLPVLIEPC